MTVVLFCHTSRMPMRLSMQTPTLRYSGYSKKVSGGNAQTCGGVAGSSCIMTMRQHTRQYSPLLSLDQVGSTWCPTPPIVQILCPVTISYSPGSRTCSEDTTTTTLQTWEQQSSEPWRPFLCRNITMQSTHYQCAGWSAFKGGEYFEGAHVQVDPEDFGLEVVVDNEDTSDDDSWVSELSWQTFHPFDSALHF